MQLFSFLNHLFFAIVQIQPSSVWKNEQEKENAEEIWVIQKNFLVIYRRLHCPMKLRNQKSTLKIIFVPKSIFFHGIYNICSINWSLDYDYLLWIFVLRSFLAFCRHLLLVFISTNFMYVQLYIYLKGLSNISVTLCAKLVCSIHDVIWYCRLSRFNYNV